MKPDLYKALKDYAYIWFDRGNLFKDPETLHHELIDTYYGGDEAPDKEVPTINLLWKSLKENRQC